MYVSFSDLPVFELETIQRRIIPPIRYLFHGRSASLLCWLNLSLLKKNDDVCVIRPDRLPKWMYASTSLCMFGDWMCIIVYTSGMFKALAKTVKMSIHRGHKLEHASTHGPLVHNVCLKAGHVCWKWTRVDHVDLDFHFHYIKSWWKLAGQVRLSIEIAKSHRVFLF